MKKPILLTSIEISRPETKLILPIEKSKNENIISLFFLIKKKS
jgi:hypothetical protein